MQTRSMSIKSALSKNPLYIPEITDHMFQFLNLSDIKNCRSVCRQWNQLATKFQKELSFVKFFHAEDVEVFNQEFPNAQQSPIFTCFRFEYFEYPLYKFASFCEKWFYNFSELALLSEDFARDKKVPYDLSPLLPVLPTTLNKLKISSWYPIIIIATDKICNIRILHLDNCILNLIPGTTLKNVAEVELDEVTFQEGGENIEEFLINPLLNFDVLKKVKLIGENIKLDVQGSHSLNVLSLQAGVTVLNWESSNWETKQLVLKVYHPCDKKKAELWESQVKYKELNTTLAHLNVSLLPEGIEKLRVTFHSTDQENPPRISGEHNFLDLKYLHITFDKVIDFSPFVEVFKHSPTLDTLTVSLQSYYVPGAGDTSILKTSAIPPSVKTLRAKDVRIILDHSFELESLIVKYAVNDAPHKGIVQVAEDSHLKNLVCVLAHESPSRIPNISDNESGIFIKSLIDLNLDNFVLGDFPQVDNSEFEKSYLFPFVDTQAKYYLFRRGEEGKAISYRDAKIYRKTAKKN